MKDFTKSHTSLTVIIVAALLIELTTGFIYYNSQDIIKRTTVRVMERENIAQIVENNPMILGSSIACIPNLFPQRGRLFEPYSIRRSDGTIETMQLGGVGRA